MHVLQRSKSDACEEQILDEVQRQVKKCVCPSRYHMHKITDGQYRVRHFGYFLALLSFIIAVTAAAAAAMTTMTVVIIVIIIIIFILIIIATLH